MKKKTHPFGLYTVYMLLLCICNFIEFKYPLSVYYPQNPAPTIIFIVIALISACTLFAYMIFAIVGTISLVLTLYSLLVKRISYFFSNVAAGLLLVSICFVGYGTFFKKYPKDSMPLIKYYGGNEIYRNNCIWRNDTIINKYGYLHIDTLVVDEENNTCHWTHKPMVNYRIEYYKKNKFIEDTIK